MEWAAYLIIIVPNICSTISNLVKAESMGDKIISVIIPVVLVILLSVIVRVVIKIVNEVVEAEDIIIAECEKDGIDIHEYVRFMKNDTNNVDKSDNADVTEKDSSCCK